MEANINYIVMVAVEFYVGNLCEFLAESCCNDMCDCADPGTGADDCHCEDF